MGKEQEKHRMNIGDEIVATRTIKLVNGSIYRVSSKGVITATPPDKSTVHVLFDQADDPCAVVTKSIRREDTPPTIGEKIRLFFSSLGL